MHNIKLGSLGWQAHVLTIHLWEQGKLTEHNVLFMTDQLRSVFFVIVILLNVFLSLNTKENMRVFGLQQLEEEELVEEERRR